MTKIQKFNKFLTIPERVATLHESDHEVGDYWTVDDSHGSIWERYQMTPDLVATQLIKDFEGTEYPVLCYGCKHIIPAEDSKIFCAVFLEELEITDRPAALAFNPEAPWPVRNCRGYEALE